MKYSEFKRKIKAEGYKFKMSLITKLVTVTSEDGKILAMVNTDYSNMASTSTFGMKELPEAKRKRIMDLCYELSTTPIKER